MSSLLLQHHPAGPANIVDDVLVEFLADRIDEHVDGVAFHLLPPSVQPLLQLDTGKDGAGPLHQGLHQRELTGWQYGGRAAICQRVAFQIKSEICRLEDRHGDAGKSAQHRSHAGDEFSYLEGLDEIIISAEVETGDAVIEPVAGSDDDQWNLIAGAPCALQDIKPRLSGQSQIEQCDAVPTIGKGFCSVMSVAYPIDNHSLTAQSLAEGPPDHAVVLDQENAHGPLNNRPSASTREKVVRHRRITTSLV